MKPEPYELRGQWALILGASSGFGGATAVHLAEAGVNIFGVHFDRKATLPNAERVQQDIQVKGVQAVFFNVNAADEDKRRDVLQQMKARLQSDGGPQVVRLLFHSLAFGTLKPYVTSDGAQVLTPAQMAMTLDVMAHSLVFWTQDLLAEGLLGNGSKVMAMTSSGGTRVWPTYGAVSAAKASLESHIRQLSLELGAQGITANCLRAGVTDTPALRKIPGHEEMIRAASERNPCNRMTAPEDVALAVVALMDWRTYWMSGNVIGIDGGEDIVG